MVDSCVSGGKELESFFTRRWKRLSSSALDTTTTLNRVTPLQRPTSGLPGCERHHRSSPRWESKRAILENSCGLCSHKLFGFTVSSHRLVTCIFLQALSPEIMLDTQWLSKTRSRPRCHGISMCIRSDSSHACSSIPSCHESQKSIFSLMQLRADAVPIDQCATWLLVGPDASVHGRSRGGWSAGVDDRSGARGSACSRCIFAIRRTCHIPKFGNLGAHLEIGRPRIGQPGQRSSSSSRPDEKGVGGRHGETVLEFSCPNRLGTKLIRLRGPRPELDLQVGID